MPFSARHPLFLVSEVIWRDRPGARSTRVRWASRRSTARALSGVWHSEVMHLASFVEFGETRDNVDVDGFLLYLPGPSKNPKGHLCLDTFI